MKKFLWSMAVMAALALTSCQGSTDYKAKGAEMARQLNELCDKQDEQAVLALDKSISEEQAAVVATGDSTAIADFNAAMKESRQRNTPYIAGLKVKNGANKEEVVKEVEQAAMKGDLSMDALSMTINEVLKADAEKNKQQPAE